MQHSKYSGSIMEVRAVEDCIRSFKSYSEGIMSQLRKHPIQGEDFPNRNFFKYYEVYLELKDSKHAWFNGGYPFVSVKFHYDYRNDVASIMIIDGNDATKKLKNKVKGFTEALAQLHVDINGGFAPDALQDNSTQREVEAGQKL